MVPVCATDASSVEVLPNRALSDGWSGGGRKRRWFYGATQEAVRIAMTDASSKKDKGEDLGDASKLTLRAYSENWLKNIEAELKPNTSASYGRLLEHHILPALGARRLRSITR